MAETEPVYFWREWAPDGFLCQWYLAPFRNVEDPEDQQHEFNCCEQWMMYKIDLLISTPVHPDPNKNTKRTKTATDPAASEPVSEERRTLAAAILAEPSPAKQKYLCRNPGVRFTRWQEKQWDKIKLEVVTQGNYYKFSQNPELKKLLMQTGDRELIEAAPNDKTWGIGFEASDAKKHVHRKDWGRNLLGVALMTVRARLRDEDGEA